MKTKLYLFLILLSGISVNLHSQEVFRTQELYRTLNGDMAISIGTGDSFLLAVSNKMLLSLDYETSKLTFRVPYETFRTGNDSLDARLKALKDTTVEFTGKIGIIVNPKNYDLQNYSLEGILTCGSHATVVQGKGTMSCLPAANRLTPACTLLFSMESTLPALNLDRIFTSAKGVRIDLRQSILEKEQR